MADTTVPARLVEIESMLDRSRRRFEEGSKLVEEAHKLLGDVQQAILGSPRSVSPEDSEEAASKLLASLKASGSESTTSEATSPTWCGASSAARPCAKAPAAAAVRASIPFARNDAITPVRTSPVPAVASAGVPEVETRTPSPGAPINVPGPFSRTTHRKRSTARRRASSRCARGGT